MDFKERLELENWNRLDDEDKWQTFQKVLSDNVNPLLPIRNIELKTFKMMGVFCRTFTLELAHEAFVFVPGRIKVMLGWDQGAEGIPENSLFWQENFDEKKAGDTFYTSSINKKELLDLSIYEEESFDLTTYEGISNYINQYTSDIRTVKMDPMLISRDAVPVLSIPRGKFHIISGTFSGDIDFFKLYRDEIKEILYPELTEIDNFYYQFPEEIIRREEYYLKRGPNSDAYQVFELLDRSYEGLLASINKWGFSLPTEDQWEYASGLGSRRLLRWGNEWNLSEKYGVHAAYKKVRKQNVFGLHYDWKKNYFELTNNPNVLKQDIIASSKQVPVCDVLPLSTYYRNSQVSIQEKEILDPFQYYYRKVITID